MEGKVISNPGAVLKKKLKKNDNQFNVSVSGILKNLKRFCALWIAVTVAVSLLAFAATAVLKHDNYEKITSLVSFTFDGVEKGLDPNGNKFYVNSIKSPEIIDQTLEILNLPAEKRDVIRRNITFEGIIPQDAINRITSYSNVFEENGKVASSEQISDTSYYPTQYRVHFDYAQTGLSASEAADFLNQMLECYNQFFFDTYGYNQSLGNSLNAFDYQDYDYAEAVDVFDSAFNKLSTYIAQVSATDTTRFRSAETELSFADLTSTISDLKTLNLDKISSYVTMHTVTKDKEVLLTYYMYKIEELQRNLNFYNETLAAVNDSIANYEKNTVMVFGSNEASEEAVSASEVSAEYDRLFEKKQTIQNKLSTTAQEIELYNKRVERINSSTQNDAAAKKAYVEEALAELNSKFNELIEAVNKTTDDYYRTVVFPKAYNVLEYANASFWSTIKHAFNDSKMSIFIIDACILVAYLLTAVIFSCVQEYRRLYGTVQAADNSSSKGKKSKKSKEKESDKEVK
ncbi:MAG: hypothetical protein ACI4KB_05800 [Oscillospiraceae bacterium]